jgi:hypothetical protein
MTALLYLAKVAFAGAYLATLYGCLIVLAACLGEIR